MSSKLQGLEISGLGITQAGELGLGKCAHTQQDSEPPKSPTQLEGDHQEGWQGARPNNQPELEIQGWSVPKPKKVSRARKPIPAPSRQSTRIPQDGIPIPEKVTTRTKKKNLDASGVFWAMWHIWNQMMIKKHFPGPSDGLFRGLSFVQKWEPLLKEADKGPLQSLVQKMSLALKNLPQSTFISDVVEI